MLFSIPNVHDMRVLFAIKGSPGHMNVLKKSPEINSKSKSQKILFPEKALFVICTL